MGTQEHLNKIAAKCRELLAIAEKRTQGKWEQDNIYVDTDALNDLIKAEGNGSNAAFIASCAGLAESGWRATIAAIDYYIKCHTEYMWGDSHPVEAAVKEIIAAWPEDLL